jgi:hypothetical protein
MLEIFRRLSDKRKSASLDGEHKPVTCYEEGKKKTISVEEIKRLCKDHTEKEPSTSLGTKLEERAWKETFATLRMKESVLMIDESQCRIMGFISGIFVGFLLCEMCVLIVMFRVKIKTKISRMFNMITRRNPTSATKYSRAPAAPPQVQPEASNDPV